MPGVPGSAPSVIRQGCRDAITVSVAYVPFGQALGATSASTGVHPLVAPDTIVTFGPDGMTGREDHQAVSAWATAAHAVAAPDGRLRYAAIPEQFLPACEPSRDDFDVFPADVFLADGLPLRTPAADLAVGMRRDPARVDRTIVALRARAGHALALSGTLGEERVPQWWSSETFVAADTARSRMPGWGTWRAAA